MAFNSYTSNSGDHVLTEAGPILSVQNLTTSFKIGPSIFKVVDNVSFDLQPGKTTALVGESGCGKSITSLSLLNILPEPPALPPEGKVIYKDQNLLNLSQSKLRSIRGAKLAMIFQNPSSSLNPVYTIGDQLNEVALIHLNLDEEEAFARSVEALKAVGIPSAEERMFDYPHQLSGGMKQRVMIAMALMCEPDILIADEPTTALDVTIQAQVLELMKSLQKKNNMAILLITHDLGVVAEVADDVLVMYASQIVERGTVEEIFKNPLHPYTQGLFASRASLAAPKSHLNAIKGSVPSLANKPSGCPFHPRCPFMMEKCKTGPVPDFGKQHIVRCWLYEKDRNDSPS